MGRVFIDESTLTAIGDAIRNKTGGEDLISPGNFAYEITNLPSGGGEPEPEPIVISGDCITACFGKVAGAYINNFGDTITTQDISNAKSMFETCSATHIPFELNFKVGLSHSVNRMFYDAKLLQEVPTMNNFKPSTTAAMFYNCENIRYFPDDYGQNWDWTYTEANSVDMSMMFLGCKSLRILPMELLKHQAAKAGSYGYLFYYNGFYQCHSLDEIVDLPVMKPTITNVNKTNFFFRSFSGCHRLKRVTFALNDDGTPQTVKWNKQSLDLSTGVGFLPSPEDMVNITGYNSGIDTDKMVSDEETYIMLNGDNDWFADNSDYSRYNHDSAVETINTLPDASAAITTQDTANIIKFKGEAGLLTDGGAINTLTEEEIAVAAAKGWTVTLI